MCFTRNIRSITTRADYFESIFFSEYASLYKTFSKPPSTNDFLSRMIQRMLKMTSSSTYAAKGHYRAHHHRKTPAIVCHHQWSLTKQPQQYFHAQLFLTSHGQQRQPLPKNFIKTAALTSYTLFKFEHFVDEVGNA